MWFDASAALSGLGEGRENDDQPPATIATSATARTRVAIVADVATPPVRKPETESIAPKEPPSCDASPHCGAEREYLRTWTGRVVPKADWRDLTDWEKHGPRGRMWNSLTRQWEEPVGDKK